jgi:hypothetical protein
MISNFAGSGWDKKEQYHKSYFYTQAEGREVL